MKVFFNHVPKCGGTSFCNWIDQNTSYKFLNKWRGLSISQLEERAVEFAREPNIVAAGHLYSPMNINTSVTSRFWRRIYDLADIKISILRNPFDRFSSYARFSGNDWLEGAQTSQYFYGNLTEKAIKSVTKLTDWRNSSLEDHLKSLLPENYIVGLPENKNLTMGINGYPRFLGFGSAKYDCMLPVSARNSSDDRIKYMMSLCDAAHSTESLQDFLSIPQYSLYAIENINVLLSKLADLDIVRSNYSPFPYHRKSNEYEDYTVKSVDKRVIAKLINEYPESYLLWKLSLHVAC